MRVIRTRTAYAWVLSAPMRRKSPKEFHDLWQLRSNPKSRYMRGFVRVPCFVTQTICLRWFTISRPYTQRATPRSLDFVFVVILVSFCRGCSISGSVTGCFWGFGSSIGSRNLLFQGLDPRRRTGLVAFHCIGWGRR